MQMASLLNRMKALPAAAKVGIVVGGYVTAILLAFGVVSVYVHQTGGSDRTTYGAMYSFGDDLLFIAVFGVISIIPTGSALLFLRQSRSCWFALSLGALVVASTSLGAVVLTAMPSQTLSASFTVWSMVAFPRLFVSPFLAVAFGLSALIAPKSRSRWYLFGAASTEGLGSVFGFLHWFAPLFFQ